MEATWVVTADRAGARLLERNRDVREGYEVIEQVEHPEGRLRDNEIDTDRAGTSRTARGTSASSAVSHTMGGGNADSAHDHKAQLFAKSIAEKLQHARGAGRFSRLVLAAEPRFLGWLRDSLDPPTARCVVESISKNLQSVALGELANHLKS
ncbi:MAG: host attachment protein [Myxococcales bacterium]